MTNTIITCFPHQQRFDEVLEKLERMGIRWWSGEKATEDKKSFNTYKEEITLFIKNDKISYSDLTWACQQPEYKSYKFYTIITAKHFLETEYEEEKNKCPFDGREIPPCSICEKKTSLLKVLWLKTGEEQGWIREGKIIN